jgi:pyruvate dehydrogenase E2 component (dihydrolipoamide acetyltransferase)
MADFTMPALGADMDSGKVVQWLVEPGARVKPGDVVAVVETHKGAIDVEIFLDGVIDDLAPLGKELPVGAVLARVQVEGEARVAAPPAPPAPPRAAAAPPPSAPMPAPLPAAPAASTHPRISPAARRRALQAGVDLAGLTGTGIGGAVRLADVELAAAAKAKPEPAAPRGPARGFDPAQMRQAIAAAMSRSKREIPHYYLTQTIAFGAASAWLADYNRDRDPESRLLPAALLLKAAALALAAVPQLNGFWVDGGFRQAGAVHLGWAIALRGGGLIAPAIHDADRRPLPELMGALRDLVQRARAAGLRSSELTDPSATVTSLGERGAESVLGVIYPPQVAMIGFGSVVIRPWVVEGQVVPCPVVAVSLAADHRASDGHLGGRLLAAIDRALQRPDSL